MFGKGQSKLSEKTGNSLMDRATEKPAAAKLAKPPANTKVQHSIISTDLTVTGDVVTTGDLTIEGSVDGSIACRTLTLGGAPSIKGDVKAETVRVSGKFSGSIAASQVHLVKSAVMKGDISYRVLTIDKGAFFEGKAQPLSGTSNGA